MKRCSRCKEEKSLSEFYINDNKGNHRPECKICYKRNKRKLHKKDPRCEMLRAARKRAKEKHLPFDITIEDLIISEVCPVLDIPLSVGTWNSPNSPTLDRVIPSLGYVKGNVMVISRKANTIKNDATPQELRRIADFYGKLKLFSS